MSDKRPALQAVLFVCSLNAVRSPMAEALCRSRYGRQIYVDSAGLQKSDRDPFMLSVLREVGIEFESDQPHVLEEVDYEGVDLVIALSPEAYARAQTMLRATAVELIHWSIPDATQSGGTREQRLFAYREVREQLDKLIREEIGGRLKGRAAS
ncbi:MAG: low molecular weight phosphatase family protein [Beijerinckiaceae bacterium]|jgi:protein-tyrosine-phosphatase|nr:low molecular weight phosphatase family protein [Beijerinckiaceae bacterium]